MRAQRALQCPLQKLEERARVFGEVLSCYLQNIMHTHFSFQHFKPPPFLKLHTVLRKNLFHILYRIHKQYVK